MNDFNKRDMSAARRRAESILRKVIDGFSTKRTQERSMKQWPKTARLRELRR